MQIRKGLLYAVSAAVAVLVLVVFGMLFSCVPSSARFAVQESRGGWQSIPSALMITPIGDYEWSRRLRNPTTSAVVGVIELPDGRETIQHQAQAWCGWRAGQGWRAILQITPDRAMCMAELVPNSVLTDRSALSEVEKVVFVAIPQRDGTRVRYAVLGRSPGTAEQSFESMAKAVESVLASLYDRITI